MANNGFIYLHRKLMESKIWREDPTKLKLFIYLLFCANHKNNGYFKRSEHITTYAKIREETGFTRNTISKCLKWLNDNNYIQIIPDKATHIRIVNYDKYQNILDNSISSTLKIPS